MYRPSVLFERTPKEYKDPELAWNRPDMAFFGAGACHILAYAFMQLHPDDGFQIVHIQPIATSSGHHIYVSNGVWAFDHNGWTKESDLLRINRIAERNRNPQWTYKRIIIKKDLAAFCAENNHMLAEEFPHSPWERAFAYIQMFTHIPPKT